MGKWSTEQRFSTCNCKVFKDFTIYSIIKRFRESGEISAGQDWKPTLNSCDLWSLKITAIKTSILWWISHSGLGNTSENTVHRCIYKCKFRLYHAKWKAIYQQHPETQLTSLGQSSSEMDWPQVEKCAVVWQVHISNSFWKWWQAKEEFKKNSKWDPGLLSNLRCTSSKNGKKFPFQNFNS